MNVKSNVSQEKHAGQVLNVPLNLIEVDKQVRTVFKEDTIAQLAADIRDNGLLQPIVIRPNGSRYRLLIGERRLRALRMIGAETAPAIIATVPDTLAGHVQLMENIQREDLNPKDLAEAIKTIWQKLGSSAAVAKAVHKSPSWVSKRLSLALSAGISTTALLDGNVKDIELLYQFSKLEKIDAAKAAALVPHILLGSVGRDQVIDHLVGLEEDAEKFADTLPPETTATDTGQIEAEATATDPVLMAQHQAMLTALRAILAVPKNLKPLEKATEMRALARNALNGLGLLQLQLELDNNQEDRE